MACLAQLYSAPLVVGLIAVPWILTIGVLVQRMLSRLVSLMLWSMRMVKRFSSCESRRGVKMLEIRPLLLRQYDVAGTISGNVFNAEASNMLLGITLPGKGVKEV